MSNINFMSTVVVLLFVFYHLAMQSRIDNKNLLLLSQDYIVLKEKEFHERILSQSLTFILPWTMTFVLTTREEVIIKTNVMNINGFFHFVLRYDYTLY